MSSDHLAGDLELAITLNEQSQELKEPEDTVLPDGWQKGRTSGSTEERILYFNAQNKVIRLDHPLNVQETPDIPVLESFKVADYQLFQVDLYRILIGPDKLFPRNRRWSVAHSNIKCLWIGKMTDSFERSQCAKDLPNQLCFSWTRTRNEDEEPISDDFSAQSTLDRHLLLMALLDKIPDLPRREELKMAVAAMNGHDGTMKILLTDDIEPEEEQETMDNDPATEDAIDAKKIDVVYNVDSEEKQDTMTADAPPTHTHMEPQAKVRGDDDGTVSYKWPDEKYVGAPIPEGWERLHLDSGDVLFINKRGNTAQWESPACAPDWAMEDIVNLKDKVHETGRTLQEWTPLKLQDVVDQQIAATWGTPSAKAQMILSTLLSVAFAALNVWFITTEALTLERDRGEAYNLTQWVVSIVEAIVVDFCALCAFTGLPLYWIWIKCLPEMTYEADQCIPVCIVFMEAAGSWSLLRVIRAITFDTVKSTWSWMMTMVAEFGTPTRMRDTLESQTPGTKFSHYKLQWAGNLVCGGLMCGPMYLLFGLMPLLVPAAMLLKLRQIDFVYGTYVREWSPGQYLSFFAFLNNIRGLTATKRTSIYSMASLMGTKVWILQSIWSHYVVQKEGIVVACIILNSWLNDPEKCRKLMRGDANKKKND